MVVGGPQQWSYSSTTYGQGEGLQIATKEPPMGRETGVQMGREKPAMAFTLQTFVTKNPFSMVLLAEEGLKGRKMGAWQFLLNPGRREEHDWEECVCQLLPLVAEILSLFPCDLLSHWLLENGSFLGAEDAPHTVASHQHSLETPQHHYKPPGRHQARRKKGRAPSSPAPHTLRGWRERRRKLCMGREERNVISGICCASREEGSVTFFNNNKYMKTDLPARPGSWEAWGRGANVAAARQNLPPLPLPQPGTAAAHPSPCSCSPSPSQPTLSRSLLSPGPSFSLDTPNPGSPSHLGLI